MKRTLALAALTLLAALGAQAQTQLTFSITVQAPPSCAVTIAPNPVSTSGTKLYAGRAGTLNFNVTACPGFSLPTATATWDGAAVVLSGSLSAAITAVQATAGTHSFVLTIPDAVLSLNTPVVLPNAPAGISYSASLATVTHLTGGIPPYTWTLTSGSLPPGLSLSSDGLVTGTPSGAGSSTFGFMVKDSSGLALNFDPRAFDFLSFRAGDFTAGLPS